MTSDEAKRLRDLETLVASIINGLPDDSPWAPSKAEAEVFHAITARLMESRRETIPIPPLNADQKEYCGKIWQQMKRDRDPKGWDAAAQPATVEQIEAIIQAHSHQPETSNSRWSRAAREIAARIPAPAVPAEIVERAKEIVARMDDHTLTADGSYFRRRASGEGYRQAAVLTRDIAAQPTPAPDPIAVELAKRLPNNDRIAAALMTQDQCNALADAAAYVRRAAGDAP